MPQPEVMSDIRRPPGVSYNVSSRQALVYITVTTRVTQLSPPGSDILSAEEITAETPSQRERDTERALWRAPSKQAGVGYQHEN